MNNWLDARLINTEAPSGGTTRHSAMSDQQQRGRQQVRPSWTTQLRAILKKTMRAKSRQRMSMLGEIFMPVQMIAWIFLMKMNLPDFRYPAVEFSAFNATEYSPFLCTFSSWKDPQECLSQDHYGPASRSIFIGFAPDSPSVQGIMEDVNASMLASGYPIQVQMFASKGDLTQAINEADECQPRSQWDPAEAACVGLEIAGSASNVEYTMYTLEGTLPKLNADLPGSSACRPYWKSLTPPIMYPGADKDGPWGQSFLPSECDVNKYMTSRFLDVQLAVNHAIAAASGATQTASLELRLEALPRQAFADTFASSTSFFRVLLSYYVVLGMGQSLQVMVTTLVKEKEKHLREGLVSMGLRNSVYWLAHAITYLIVQFIICWGIVAMLFVVGMGKSSSPLLLFVLVYSFAITLIVLSFAVSTLYDKARSAGANAMFAVMILTTPFMALQYVELSSGQLHALALLSPLAFCVGLDATWAFEGGYASVEGLSFTSISVAGPLGLSVAQCLMMIWVDVFLYTLLLLYLERVVPQGLWTPEPLWFPCNPRFFRRQGGCGAPTHPARISVGPATIPADDCAREAMVPDTGSVEVVRLNAVKKVFPAKYCSGFLGRTSENDVTAVDNVSLTLHSGQIFGLLGHNGADHAPPDHVWSSYTYVGTAYVNGLDVTTSINEVRQSLGVCPQHDLLFENLTVMEHIQLYASLKGVQRADVKDAGMAWLARVGLTEKAWSMATTLSGGQKRRLSVAMSLIGDPNVIYLDEPTTGLDPAARRSLWKILKNSREGRLILLSTHFMDEADILADQKAIIAHGRLQCLGSSLWLKVHFGLGYSLELTKADPLAPVQPVEALVSSHVPDAVLQQDSSDGAVFKLPIDAVKSFGALLTDLDSNMGHFKLESYGVTMGTLEEIFMRFADGGDLADIKPSDKRSNKATIDSTLDVVADKQGSGPDMQAAALDEDAKRFSWARVGAMMRARMVFTWKNKESSGVTLFLPILLAAIMVNLPDPNTTSSEPTPTTVQSLVTSLLGGTAATELLISLSPDVDAPFGQVQSWLAEETQLQVLCWDDFATDPECKGGSLDIAPAFAANAQMRQELRGILVLNQVNLDADPSGGWDVTLMYNTGTEAAVLTVYASLVGNAVLRNVTTQVPDGPYGLGASMEEIHVETNVPFSFSAMPIMICFVLAFPPVALCAMLVRDNELKTRFQLSVMGLSSIGALHPRHARSLSLNQSLHVDSCCLTFLCTESVTEYWTSTYLQNLALLCVPYGVCYILMIAFGVEPISGPGAGPYAVLMVEFMLAITLYVYLFSHLFTSHEKVFQILPSVLQLSAMLCQMTVLILLLMDPDSDLPLTMHKLFSWLLPQYGICGALVYMQYQMVEDRMLAQMTNTTAPSYFSNDGVQVTMVAYAVQIPVFFFMLIMIDRLKHNSKEFVDTVGADDGEQVDEDVAAEQRTVDTATPDTLAIRARKLRKVFPPADAGGCAKPDEKPEETVAVRGLSIGVRPNECLGLLGPNGAGKTTTFRMMTADESPSSGEIHVSGYSAATEAYKVWRSLGFCPQHDALWPELSARHHLDLYARLKGKTNPDEAVSSMLDKLDLAEHADKMTSEMSGGNRRKLSAAIALVAAPKVSVLDEPSSGMDVATRVHMWEMVRQSLSTGAVVLTTHSMEEAEKLSTRIAIMTKGKLRCIGTPAHLKHRFGRGYRVELKVGGSEPVQDGSQLSGSSRLMEEAGQFVEQELGGTVLESFGTRLTAAVPACSEQSPAAIFRLLETRCEALSISDYSVSQPTMEQIFLDFALHEDESEGEEE